MSSFSRRSRRAAQGHPRLGRSVALAITATSAVLVAGLPGTASAATVELPHTLGMVKPTASVAASGGLLALARQQVADGEADSVGEVLTGASSLPESVDLTEWAVPPGDQGPHGACASFTTAYTIAGWLSNYTGHTGEPYNPMYVYNQVNGGSDTKGTTFGANFGVLESQGVAESVYWTQPFSDYKSKPTTAEKANAALHKLSTHTTLAINGSGNLGDAVETAIKTSLADNDPVALAIPVYSAFMNLDSSDSTFTSADVSGSSLGGHAVAVLGYDSTGVIIENSWGSTWGDGGYATIGWDFINRYAWQADSVNSFTNGQTSLPPVVTGLSTSAVTTAGGGALTITAARVPSIDLTDAGAVTFVSTTNPSVTVDATVTGHTATTVTVTVPALPADGSYRVVLTGSGGVSTANRTVDTVTAATPYSVTLASGQAGRSNAATKVTLVGSGFGTTSALFGKNKITAKVNGATAAVTRVDDTHVQVTVPKATAGTTSSVVLLRNGVASTAVSVPIKAPLPAVTKVTPNRSTTAGGTAVTVTAKFAPTSAESSTVTLVSTTDSSVTATAPITARTTGAVTFTSPALAAGSYHVVLTNSGGTSTQVTADVLTYRVPYAVSATTTTVPGAAGTLLPLTGSGFGTTTKEFAANKVTATVAGKTAKVTWVSDTAVKVTVPAGKPGATASLVVLHDGVAGTPLTLTYAAAITKVAMVKGAAAGWTTTVSGVGFAGSTGWQLLDGDGATVASLPVVATKAALTSSTDGGVYLTSATSVSVRLPAAAAGTYTLSFTPSSSAYPDATLLATSTSSVTYKP